MPPSEKAGKFRENISFFLLFMLIALSPIPFGSNVDWSKAAVFLFTGIISISWGISLFYDKSVLRVHHSNIRSILIFFSLLTLWILLQVLLVSPKEITHPLWQLTSSNLGIDITPHISLNPEKTTYGLIRLISFALIFYFSMQFCRGETNARRFIKLLAACAVAYALYGLFVEISGSQTVLGFKKTAYKDSLTSTFLNRNTYATYAGIGVLIFFSMAFGRFFVFLKYKPRRRVFEYFVTNHAFKISLYMLGVLLLFSALILTNSRGGIISTILGIVALFISVAISKESGISRKSIISGLIIIGIFVMTFFAYSSVDRLNRFEKMLKISQNEFVDNTLSYKLNDGSLTTRAIIYKNSMLASIDSPLFGTGLGTFEDVFRQYRGMDFPFLITARVDFAHSVYIESILEMGYVGFILFILPFFFLFFIFIKGLGARRKNVIFPALGVSSSVLVGIHSFVDFSVQIPAVTLLYASLAGACCAQSWQSKNSGEKVTKRTALITVAVTLLLGVMLSIYGTKHMVGAFYNITEKDIVSRLSKGKIVTQDELISFIESGERSLKWNDISTTHHNLGIVKMALAEKYGYGTAEAKELINSAREHQIESLFRAPANPYDWNRLAFINTLQNGGYNEDTRKALIMSVMTGPYELNLISYRLETAFGDWQNYTREQKELLNSQICIGWKGYGWKIREAFKAKEEKDIVCSAIRKCSDIVSDASMERYCGS